MGCVSSKQFHGDEHGEFRRPKRGSSGSLRRLVSSSKWRESAAEEDYVENISTGIAVPVSDADHTQVKLGNLAQVIARTDEAGVQQSLVLDDDRRKASTLITQLKVVDDERRKISAVETTSQKVSGQGQRLDADVKLNGGVEVNSYAISRIGSDAKLRILDVPKGVEAEHIAAGWPLWLTEVAGEAVRGWLPRKGESFEKLDKIGQGTYSSVYKARDLENGKVVALKKVRFANMDPESVRFMAREIHILRRLDHPNVIKLEGLITSRTSSSLYLVFEYMEHDLAGLIASPSIKFSEPQVKCYMQQLFSGLDYCHKNRVLHRDIKGANLLLNNNGVLKIADFGLATFFKSNQKQHLTSRVVTLWYRPPELLLGATDYGATVDLWSAGCILAELLYGKPVMPGRTEVEQLHKIFKLCGSPSEEFWANLKLSRAAIFKPQQPYRRIVGETFKDFPPSALALLDRLLAVEPANRGTAASALQSEFFTTKPFACDPSNLPKYPPSKEYDSKLRDEEARRQKAAASGKIQESDSSRRRPIQDPDGGAARPRLQSGMKTKSHKYSGKEEDHVNGILVGPQGRMGENGTSQLAPLASAGHSSSNLGRTSGPDQKLQTAYAQPASPADLSKRTAARISNLGETARHQYAREHRSSLRYNPSDNSDVERPEWSHQLLARPPTAHRKDDQVGSKESSMVTNSSRKGRMHFSGPLMPPGTNIEEMLREQEWQIQQAVRKARIDKAKGKHGREKDGAGSVVYGGGWNIRTER